MKNKKETSYKWIALMVVAMALFMVSLDMSIVNLAISQMMLTFNATLNQIQWVLSAYTLALGITMPVSGYLSERFGMKKIIIISLILFTLGSLLCSIAWNTPSIIVFRIIQGLGGGLIIPVSLAFLLNTFDKSERSVAIAAVGIANMVAPALGPTFGGYLIENFNWRVVFTINIPIGIICIILAFIILRETELKFLRHFDLIGLLTSSIGLGCTLYVLGEGNIDWGNIHTIMFMIIGVSFLIMFIINELLIPEPMLDLKLFKNYTFAMSNIILNIAILALFGGIFLVPIFLQQIKGLNPFQTGMVLFPEAIATAVGMVVSPKLTKKFGVKIIAVLALILLAFNGYGMSKFTLDTSNTAITLLLMVRGLGVGFLLMTVQMAAFNSLPTEAMTNASALLTTVKQIGTSIGITIVSSVMQQRNTINYANLANQINVFNPNSLYLSKMLQGVLMQNGISRASTQGGALTLIYGMVTKLAQLQSLNDTMMVITIITLVVILPTLLLKGSNNQKDDESAIMLEESNNQEDDESAMKLNGSNNQEDGSNLILK